MVTPGTRIGPYEALEKLGEGGMGQVYRATDTRLGRQVALKLLPGAFAADSERLARFDREARTLASLNHPDIAHIYGIETIPTAAGGHQSALVMELVEGKDLAEQIARGPIPVDEALVIARQIADALAAAHEQRVVHRDLKPANIKIREDGTVKILDFGLAKAVDPNSGTAAAITSSPTFTSPVMTGAGTIVGTAACMSPEQARGRTVDRRADIWAFGCVLYEMLTGRRPFHGSDVTDVLAAVIRDAPALEALPGDVPVPVRRLLRRCLEKDPARRLDSMRAARLELDEADERPARQEPFTRRGSWLLPITIAVLAIPILVFSGFVLGRGTDRTAAAPVHAELSLAPAASLGPPSAIDRPARRAFVLTSDGRRIVFAGVTGGTTQLYVRSLEARQAIAIAGTAGAQTPFLSPDDQWVGFLADGQIRSAAGRSSRSPISRRLIATRHPRSSRWEPIFVAPVGERTARLSSDDSAMACGGCPPWTAMHRG
jgi:eukaryotic-like serine/threonine-protein kinase